MASLLTIDVDSRAVLAALDKMGHSAQSFVKDAAEVTANNIAREADRRVARATGETAAGITVEETHDGKGYVVFVARPSMPGLPGWIEHGTRYMPSRGFLFVSARLEESGHLRRTAEALQDAIDTQGLGD